MKRADRKRKERVDWVIDKAFWKGFQEGLGDGLCNVTEYASDSGLYDYNGVKRIAESAGYDLAQRVLADHVARLNGETRRIPARFEYKVPAEVVARCYGEARLVA